MDIRVSWDGAVGLLVISVPWLVLLCVAWLGRRRERPKTSDAPASHLRSSDAPSCDAPRDVLPSDGGPARQSFGIMTASSSDHMGAASAVEEVAPAPAMSLQEQEDSLAAAIAEAKSARDDPQISRNSVALARLLLARSARPQASTLLQSAVMSARRAGLPVVHAEARIELAELALAEGDLTSACEHWQMAKQMFHETGRRSDQERMADLMRRHRCPSDWILTNF